MNVYIYKKKVEIKGYKGEIIIPNPEQKWKDEYNKIRLSLTFSANFKTIKRFLYSFKPEEIIIQFKNFSAYKKIKGRIFEEEIVLTQEIYQPFSFVGLTELDWYIKTPKNENRLFNVFPVNQQKTYSWYFKSEEESLILNFFNLVIPMPTSKEREKYIIKEIHFWADEENFDVYKDKEKIEKYYTKRKKRKRMQ